MSNRSQSRHGGVVLNEFKPGAVIAPEIMREDSKVRFSLKFCDTNKFCIRNVSNQEIKRLYATLAHFENMTWGQFRSQTRDNGLSVEKKTSPAHQLFHGLAPSLNTFGHFRVDGTDKPFRIFGGIENDLLYIIYFDKEGSLQH